MNMTTHNTTDGMKTYKTSDRYLVTWLRHEGYKYVRTEVINRKQVLFHFEDTEELAQSIIQFNNKEKTLMSAYVFAKEIDSVMEIIYQTLNNS